MANNSNVFNFWSTIVTLDEAKEFSRSAFVAALICAGITSLLAILALVGVILIPGFNALALVDATIFAGLALGIYRYSRTCAVLALVFYVVEQVNNIAALKAYSVVMALFFIVLYLKGIRGTFAYHRLKNVATEVAPPDA